MDEAIQEQSDLDSGRYRMSDSLPAGRGRDTDFGLCFLDWMDELYAVCLEAYSSIRIGTRSSVFEVTLDGTADV